MIAEKVAAFLNTDPAKIEKVLSKEQGNIAKTDTIEKAEEVVAAFRDAGVEVALVEDKKVKASPKINVEKVNLEEKKVKSNLLSQAKKSDLQNILILAKRQKVLIYLFLFYLVLSAFYTSTDRESGIFLAYVLTLVIMIFGARLYWRLYKRPGAIIRIVISTIPLVNLLVLLMASSKVNKLVKNQGFKTNMGGANIREIREAILGERPISKKPRKGSGFTWLFLLSVFVLGGWLFWSFSNEPSKKKLESESLSETHVAQSSVGFAESQDNSVLGGKVSDELSSNLQPNFEQLPKTVDSKKVDTVTEFVEQAKQGGKIEIGVGEYMLDEPLTLSRDVELIGAGQNRTFILSSFQGHVVKFEGNGEFIIKRISFEHTGNHSADALYITNGVIEIDNCRFTGGIRDEKNKQGGNGLLIAGSTQGVVKNSVSERNGLYGIVVTDEAQIRLEKNTLLNNTEVGIAYFNNSEGTALYNTSKRNMAGIFVGGEAQPRLEQNILQNNTHAGIAYANNAGGIAMGNLIEKNGGSGILVANESQPKLEQNTLRSNAQNGITYLHNAGGIAVGNISEQNGFNGISVTDESQPRLEQNTLRNNIVGI